MRVPLLDLQAQYSEFRDEAEAAIRRVCDSQWFIMGPEVEALESEIAALCGVAHGIGVSSGTDALLAALMAYDIGPGDEVITTPYSFFATAGVVARLGARPVFVDILPESFNLDHEAAVAAITPRTRALLPVHLYGRCAEMTDVVEAGRQHGIPVIEDAAQAIGARTDAGEIAGSLGDCACFSFFPSKNLGAFGDAGMIVTDDDELADRLRTLRVHGARPKYHHQMIGGNFRIDALQAAVLGVKLPRLEGWTEARRRNADRYRKLFAEADLGDLVVLPSDRPGHIYNQFVIRARDRDRLRDRLSEREIGTEVYYPIPLHLQACFSDLGYEPGDLPNAERAAAETLALPIYPELGEARQRYVVNTIADFYSRPRDSRA